MSSDKDEGLTVEEFADGLALWEEHRPRSPEDWIAVARRCNEAKADRSVMNPILAALCIVLDHPETCTCPVGWGSVMIQNFPDSPLSSIGQRTSDDGFREKRLPATLA